MKHKKIIVRFSFLLAVIMLFTSFSTVAFAAETNENTAKFGDILYVDEGVTVFWGNPYESKEATLEAKAIEEKATRAMQYSDILVDANTIADKRISIPATTSNSITYFTVRQESSASVPRSYIYVYRPDENGSVCLILNWGGQKTIEAANKVVSTTTLALEGNSPYTWTSGKLSLRWDVETGSSGARINLWVW